MMSTINSNNSSTPQTSNGAQAGNGVETSGVTTTLSENTVAFADQSANQHVVPSGKGKIVPNDAHQLSVKLPDFEKGMAMPKLIGSFNMELVDNIGFPLFRINSGAIYAAIADGVIPADTPGYVTWDRVVLTLTAATNPFSNGIVGVCVVPRADARTDVHVGYTTGGVDLNPSHLHQNMVEMFEVPSDSSVEIPIPNLMPTGSMPVVGTSFYSPNTFLSGDFEVIFFVFHQLEYGSGGGNLDFEVYAKFDGFRMETVVAQCGDDSVESLVFAHAGNDDDKDGADMTTKTLVKTVRKAVTGVGKLAWPSGVWNMVDEGAELFGFGVPRAENTVSVLPVQNMSNQGPRQIQTLGNMSEEDKPTFPAMGTSGGVDPDVDELSFNNMLTVPYFVYYDKLAPFAAAGVLLNHPCSFSAPDIAGGTIETSHPLHLLKYFAMARGTLRFIVTIASSKQRARFLMGFVPGYNHDFSTATQKQMCPNVNFSIGEDVEGTKSVKRFIFDIPYTSIAQYARISEIGSGPALVDREVFGYFTLRLLTPIIGPDTCGGITISVHTAVIDGEASGANELDALYVPCMDTANQSVAHSGDSEEGMIKALTFEEWDSSNHSNGGVVMMDGGVCPMHLPYFSGRRNPLHYSKAIRWSVVSNGKDPYHRAAQVMAGAPVNSFRVLVNKLMPLYYHTNSLAMQQGFANGEFGIFSPVIDEIGFAGTQYLLGDLICLIRSFFAYESGNLAVLTMPAVEEISAALDLPLNVKMSTMNVNNPAAWTARGKLLPTGINHSMWNYPNECPVAQAEVPRYAMYPFQAQEPNCPTVGWSRDDLDTTQMLSIVSEDRTGEYTFWLYRSGTNSTSYKFRRPPAALRALNTYA